MKKRIVSLLLSIMMILTVIPAALSSASLQGDVNGDGKITAADARLTLRASVKLENLDANQIKAADVDGKAGLTAADARLILRASVGLENLHTHAYTKEEITKAATCTKQGEKKLSCECGDFITEAIPMKAHSYTKESVSKAPTCTKQGEKKLSCECGAFITEAIPMTAHSYTKESVSKAATCTEKGEKKLSCECGKFITEAIPAKGHTSVTDKAVAATCTSTGKTEGSHCSVCNTVIKAQTTTNALPHDYQLDASTVIAVTCKTDGYSGDTKCTVCKALKAAGSVITSTGTEHITETEVHEATCGQDGYTIDKCTVCELYDETTYKKTADAKAHTFGSWETAAPDCTNEGYDYRVCSACNTEERQNIVAEKGHSYKWTTTDAPTCKKTGTEKGVCSVCQDTTTRIMPIADHNTQEIHPENEPCRTIVKCKDCDFVKSDITKHTIRVIPSTKVDAGCENDGQAFRYCANCNNYGTDTMKYLGKDRYGKTETTDFATGHQPTSTITIQPRTCTQDGIYEYTGTCANGCGTTFSSGTQIVLEATGHKIEGVTAPTCTENVVCSNEHCDAPDKILEAKLGHSNTLTTAAYNTPVTKFFCDRCGTETAADKDGKIQMFNTLTDKVKTYHFRGIYSQNKTLHYISKTSVKTSYSKFDFGAFTSTIRDMYEEEMANTPDEYSKVQTGYGIMWALPVDQQHISTLTGSDIDAISIERFSGVDFNSILGSFNPTYENKTEQYRTENLAKLDALKAISLKNENIIKVTINVKNESMNDKGLDLNNTSLSKIHSYNMKDIIAEYNEIPDTGADEITMSTQLNDIKTDAQVTYYFLESTYEPIIAVYSTNVVISQSIDMVFELGIFKLSGEMDPIIDTTTTEVYVFPNFTPKGN